MKMKLSIVSFNIRCCDDPDGHSIDERALRLKEILVKENADLIGFQEYTPKWHEFIVENFGYEYEIFNKYRAESQLESAPILWKKDKFECISKGYFWLSDTPEVESRGWDERSHCYRICEYVILNHKETNKQFTFMNTHFGFGDGCQTKSAELIHKYSEKISSNPTFITGDFNMKHKDKGYSEITKYFKDVNKLTSNDLRTTYHGYGKASDAHIDFCFINEKITPVQLKMLTETFSGKYPSDHYGLYIELEI